MIVLDTHAALWALADPDRLSPVATEVIEGADDIGVAAITWYELAWLVDAGRVEVEGPLDDWLATAATVLRTLPITWQIARAASDLGRHAEFPMAPADRLIYATSVHHDAVLLTRDRALRDFDGRTCRW